MKFTIASLLLFSANVVAADKVTYYSAGDAGVTDLEGAAKKCESDGLAFATQSEWCTYATANSGQIYGMAPILGESGAELIDVEAVCGITPAPTPAPTEAPQMSRNYRGSNGRGIQRTSGRVGRGGRALAEDKVESLLCSTPPPAPTKASGSGDPHFKTWTGEKFDYHGECDLVLLDNPSFGNRKGMKIHIRTTRVKYFSYIEKVALQIGDDTLEFANDVENFLINGEKAEPNQKHHKTMFAGYVLRRDPRAISLRLDEEGKAKIDFHTRKNGFPAVIVDAGSTNIFEESLGMLGEWKTGKKLARDGVTEIEVDPENGEGFALEWQVRDTEPMLFQESRFPQFPQTCIAPEKMPKYRLGMDKAKAEAEEACAHWEVDKDDCIFDVMATRDVLVADEGHIIHVE